MNHLISTADEIDQIQSIVNQGFEFPDPDGSISTITRQNALLNNSFDEKETRETLKDLYWNHSEKLKASNHATVNFYQWHGKLSDFTFLPNSSTICELVIPTEDRFLPSEYRDPFKLSPYDRKWITCTEIMNHPEVFPWCLLVFINQRIFSEWELRMDDHEITIRFQYYHYWNKMDYPVYLYKFDTKIQTRMLISRELCTNQWNWRIPLQEIPNQKIGMYSNVILAINKTSDQNVRKDGITSVEVLGDNLEFAIIQDGYLDLTNLSTFNKNYIESEIKEYLYLSIFVPKYFHEYPILLPTDVIYRPYEPRVEKIYVEDYENQIHPVKISVNKEIKNVYVDMGNGVDHTYDGWNRTIRPMVLSDLIEHPDQEPSHVYKEELLHLRDLCTEAADKVEVFRFFLKSYTTDEEYLLQLDSLRDVFLRLREAYYNFLEKDHATHHGEYEEKYENFLKMMDQIQEEGIDSKLFENFQFDGESDYFFQISPLIYIPRNLVDQFQFLEVIDRMEHQVLLPRETKPDQTRFNRPIDPQDIWTFEYDSKDDVWRPYPLSITYHYPDVYLLKDEMEETPSSNRIFKTFFFYSDMINVRKETVNVEHPSVDWDQNMEKYQYHPEGTYRDIYLEKFYWMGLKSVYKGMLHTNTRWELLEYIMDQPSYQRFHDLFLDTMHPYEKLGLNTYIQSDHYGFLFDETISRMKKSLQEKFLGYQKVTWFETYLNRTWKPSYFDYLISINGGWNYQRFLIRRPRASFDILRVHPWLISVQDEVIHTMDSILNQLSSILFDLQEETYQLNVSQIESLETLSSQIEFDIKQIWKFTKELDLDIYGIDDVNYILNGLRNYIQQIQDSKEFVDQIQTDATDHCIYESKRKDFAWIQNEVHKIPSYLDSICNILNGFEIDAFMKTTNDLRSYFDSQKNNPEDESLLGYINKFYDPWSIEVKKWRDQLFSTSATLYGTFDETKSYSMEEVNAFVSTIQDTMDAIYQLREVMEKFWREHQYQEDQTILNRMDESEKLLRNFSSQITAYMQLRKEFSNFLDEIQEKIKEFYNYPLSKQERYYWDQIQIKLKDLWIPISYLAGTNSKEDATECYDFIDGWLFKYDQFLTQEESVFQRIFSLSNDQYQTLENQFGFLQGMIQYLDTVNQPYIPDSIQPNYLDVYTCNQVEIVSRGFQHLIHDTVYAPDLGIYQISSVGDKIGEVLELSNVTHRNTVFRNPMIQSNPYDTITNGTGMGIQLKPTKTNCTHLRNDEVVTPYFNRIQTILFRISQHVITVNSYDNINAEQTISWITSLKNDWKNTLNIYSDHLSYKMNQFLSAMIQVLEGGISHIQELMDIRKGIQLELVLDSYRNFLLGMNQNDSNFQMIQIPYDQLKEFYGNGTKWKDGNALYELLDEAKYPLSLYYNRILKGTTGTLVDQYEILRKRIDRCMSAIQTFPNHIIDLNQIVSSLGKKLKEIPDIVIDKWYRIISVTVGFEGTNYQKGDIVQIIPELPTDREGNPIYDQEDIILDDVIFVKILNVNEGKAVDVVPFMDYALPYELYGIRETVTCVGKGTGLTVDFVSKQVSVSDSTLFDDSSSEQKIVKPFGENDLFRFPFENVRDLDLNYEVFLGGKQISNFYQRHLKLEDLPNPSKWDFIYVNANEVMELQNTSVYISAEHYFNFKLKNIKVIEPGAGYYVGQTIYVDTDQLLLPLKVTELTNDPFKGIQSVSGAGIKLPMEIDEISTDHANVISDVMNNIDDEFHEDNKNTFYMHSVMKKETNGDPDYHWYIGNRFDESIRSQGISPLIFPVDGIIPVDNQIPMNQSTLGDYQSISRQRIHNSIGETNDQITKTFEHSVLTEPMTMGDLTVPTYRNLPKNRSEWKDGEVGKSVIVTSDETQKHHRMLYKIKSFLVSGDFVYDHPLIIDETWNTFQIDWLEIHRYIHKVTVDDLSVYNWTTHQWEDLHDYTTWRLERKERYMYEFTLTYLKDGIYSYDMELFLNKVPDTQLRNATLKQNAVLSLSAYISSEVNHPGHNYLVTSGNQLRIRKLFPYEQRELFTIGRKADGELLGYTMEVTLSPYIHFRNELHLEDIKVYHKSAGRYENVLDPSMYEVRFFDPKSNGTQFEIQTKITQVMIGEFGKNFIDGTAWAYNQEYELSIFGLITTSNGRLESFTPMHWNQLPEENIVLEFLVYQSEKQTISDHATVILEFQTENLEVYGDGWIHQVNNPMAPIPEKFQLIVQYNLDGLAEYEVIITKTSKTWTFIRPTFLMSPTFHLPDYQVSSDQLYAVGTRGRFPLINPATGKPTLRVVSTSDGTDVTFLNLYRKQEHFEIHSVPYPMRSVYTQRTIPQHGYLDLSGKLNKPLNKKYFEFWVNGKLMCDEVTIISPTKLIFHGLKSLKNLEIIEINRDSNEYYSDTFGEVEKSLYGREYYRWNYRTYLDDALDGTLPEDNYTEEEQESLLTPVWKQVDSSNPEYKQYPPNVDVEEDVLIRAHVEDYPIEGLEQPFYSLLVVDSPTIEKTPIVGNVTLEEIGFRPYTNEELVDLLNEEWAEEIATTPNFPVHTNISDEEWYGMVARMYNRYGEPVQKVHEKDYYVTNGEVLRIHAKNKIASILENTFNYNFD